MVFSSSRTLPRQGCDEQQALGRRRDGPERHAVGFGIFVREVARQREDVLRPLAQGGQAQIDDVQAIEQVFAERAALDGFGQVAVRGGDDADVDLDRLGAADAVDLAFLDGAQQLGLQARIHLADFVEQQRAAIGFLEFADAPGDGAGERAFLMAEQFGFEQVFGNGGAVDRDERLVGARRFAVDVARQHFLAGAAFAGDEDRGFAARDLVGQRKHRAHRFVFIDELVALVGDGCEHSGDQLGIGRQRQIFLGAGADRIDGAPRVGADAAGDDRRADAFGGQRATRRPMSSVTSRHHEIGAVAAAQARPAPAR